MTTWIRFKTDGVPELEVCAPIAWGCKHTDGKLNIGDTTEAERFWTVHPDDAPRVWAELCAMCKPDHSGDAGKKVTGPYTVQTYNDGRAHVFGAQLGSLAVARFYKGTAEENKRAAELWAEQKNAEEGDHSGDANKMVPTERTGPEVRRLIKSFYIGGAGSWSVTVDPDCGFPPEHLDRLGRFIADCVNGVYVGEKASEVKP